MKNINKKRGAVALIVILGFGMLVLTMSLAVSTGAILGFVGNRDMVSSSKAFYTAESAVSEGIYQRIGAIGYGGGNAPLINESSGMITITDLPSYRILVKGETSNNQSNRAVEKMITQCPSCESISYAIYSGGSLLTTGNSTINGNVHANGSLDINGSSDINGDASASGSIDGEENISGEYFSNTLTVPPPQIDYDLYKSMAENSETFFSSSAAAEDYMEDFPNSGAVVYIEKPSGVSIDVSNFFGAIITPNNLDLKGTFTAPDNFPAVATKGTLKMKGNTNINGIVYVEGEVDNTGSNNVINGSLIYTNPYGSPKIKGTITVNYDPSYFEDLEDFIGFEAGSVGTSVMFLDWGES